jgi:hypothetical protein
MHRHDIYGPIHKGIRLALAELVIRIGSTDFDDEAAARDTLAALRHQMMLSASHLAHEEAHIHGALEARAEGATLTLLADHDHHRRAFDEIEALMQAIEATPAGEREALGRRLYLDFSRFVAADFAHMAEEEMVILPLLHRLFTDEEIIAMEAAIVAALPPEKVIAFMKIAIPGMNRPERIRFLNFVRGGAPAEAFEAIRNFAARPTLTPDDYRAVELGLAA